VDLESTSRSLELWLYLFVALVVIGVVLEVGFVLWEYRGALEEYQRGTIRSPHKPSGWRLCFELLGAALVAIGVAGELGVDIKSGTVQTGLRTKNGELIQLLEGVSGAALSNAAQLGIDLETEKQKTARFQREADAARLALSNQVKEQGPRWPLIRGAKQELVSVLSPFVGQRADIYISGPRILADEETMSTWGALADALGGDGAKWKLEHGGLTFAERDRRVLGIHIWVSTKAVARTAEAAKALAAELIKILPPSSDRTLIPEDPDRIAMLESKAFPPDKDAPYVLAARDPDLITIMIGAHPQQ
jgi:hypothetical protein